MPNDRLERDFDLDALRMRLARDRPLLLEGNEVRARAAVAAVLRQGGAARPEVLLIRRATQPHDPWSGHMAFPGGRMDPGDPDLLATSLRETREELGIDLSSSARLLGRLDDVPAIARGRATGMVIAPYVFEAVAPLEPQVGPEVQECLWAPVLPMVRRENRTQFPYVHEGTTYSLPAFDVDGRIVWGLTHQMLELLFKLARTIE